MIDKKEKCYMNNLIILYFVSHLVICPKSICKMTCLLVTLFFSGVFIYYIKNLIKVTTKRIIIRGSYMY